MRQISILIIIVSFLLAGCDFQLLPSTVESETQTETESTIDIEGPHSELLELLSFIPDASEYTHSVVYGSPQAWYESWNLEQVDSVDKFAVKAGESGSFYFNMLRQTGFLLSKENLDFTQETFGFDFFSINQYVNTGWIARPVSVLNTQPLTANNIPAFLNDLNYEIESISNDVSIYSICEDYAFCRELSKTSVSGASLGYYNRIWLNQDRIILSKSTEQIEQMIRARSPQTPSIADSSRFRTMILGFESLNVPEKTPLIGAIFSDDPQYQEASFYDDMFRDPEKKQTFDDYYASFPIEEYELFAMTTHYANETTFLSLMLLHPKDTAVRDTANNLAQRIDNYTSILQDEAIYLGKSTQAQSITVNGYPISIVSFEHPMPAALSDNASELAAPTWNPLFWLRETYFLVHK